MSEASNLADHLAVAWEHVQAGCQWWNAATLSAQAATAAHIQAVVGEAAMPDVQMYMSYVALMIMAITPIYYGSWQAVKSVIKGEKKDESESLSTEDAKWFPVVGSCVLFGLYLLFRYFDPKYINLLLTAYFAIFGCFALAKQMDIIARRAMPCLGSKTPYHLSLNQDTVKKQKKTDEAVTEEQWKFSFDGLTLCTLILSVAVTVYYVYTKHWLASNAFGLSFATSAIQMLALDSFTTGMILLAGLFFYDIFWVFGTEVMVTVAKNFDAPIKLLFPRNVLEEKFSYALLGLGDIVIPGIFVALALKFDLHQHVTAGGAKNASFSTPYFRACLVAYVAGLATTMFVMHYFKAAQPALLYLSPACILAVLITGVVRGELGPVFKFSTEEEKKEEDAAEERKPRTRSRSASPERKADDSTTRRRASRKTGQ